MLDQKKVQAVQESFGRCCIQGMTFFDKFYDIFIDCSPIIRQQFANTDFSKQKQLLRHGITMMIGFAKGGDYAQMHLGKIGASHSRMQMNIDPKLYPLWIESLVKTVGACDKKYTPELGNAWRDVMTHGVNFIKSMY